MRQRPKPLKPRAKLPVAPKSPKNQSSKVRDLEKRLAEALKDKADALGQLQTSNRELAEAQEQQAATAEILRVIGSSPTDVQPVFDAIAESAFRLLSGAVTAVLRRVGEGFRVMATHSRDQTVGMPPNPDYVPIDPAANFPSRVFLGKTMLHIPDWTAIELPVHERAVYERMGIRSSLMLPLLRDADCVGVLVVARASVHAYSDKEIALMQSSADQAVIAIENVRLFNETKEALERQTATSEILRVISSSPTDTQPVFEAIARNAARLCAATRSSVNLIEGEWIQFVAQYNLPEGWTQIHVSDAPNATRVIRDGVIFHVADAQTDVRVTPEALSRVRTLGARSFLMVPLHRETMPIGSIVVYRSETGSFSDQQVELLQTFAEQAVIAIENVRLFKELETRNRDLTESLDQQTATSAILRVISGSPTDVQPIFDAIAASATRLCEADFSGLYQFDGTLIHFSAQHGRTPEEIEAARQAFPQPLGRASVSARAILDAGVVQVSDLREDPEIADALRALFRTVMAVPMMRDGRPIGTITVARRVVRPFSDEQIALLKTFADQAVIAIENVRLFTELQEKNHALTEALTQQTATSEVLKVISRSTFDLQPVLQTLIEHATRLCDAQQGFIYRSDGEIHQLAVDFNAPPAFTEWSQQRATRPGDGSVVGRVALEKRVVQILDAQADAEWRARTAHAPGITDVRTLLGVPMLRDGVVIGVFAMWRSEIRAFTDKQIDLVKTFADQAVIAIENVRLFTELQTRNGELTEALEQQTATADILRVISRSPTELQPVLATVAESAARVCWADDAMIRLVDGDGLRLVTHYGPLPDLDEIIPRDRGSATGRAIADRRAIHIHDLAAESEGEFPVGRSLQRRFHHRTVLAVPLLRESVAIGGILIRRQEVRPFSDKQITLLQTFADQAVIAIENVRLFNELEAANRELAAASQHKSEFLASMSHELRTPLNAIIGFSEVLSEKMFGELNEKQEEYSQDIHASGQHLLSLINDILDLSKIEAGRMELELTVFHLPTALDNALTLVRERAGRKNVTLQTSVDERLGEVRADERKIRQVVLNLLSNAIKFTPEGGRIEVGAAPKDGLVEVSVSDTGVGIAPDDHEAVFEEFRQVGTAEKKAEGTGLGLTLCRKFIELHGGRIWVKSQVGVGSTFTFTIPVRHGE